MSDVPEAAGNSGFLLRARDVEIHLWEGVIPPASSNERIGLFKPRAMLSAMDAIIDGLAPKRMVEVGLYDGGSAIYWERRHKPERLALFDIREEVPYLSRYVERHGLAESMRLHFGISQDDRMALRQAVAADFGGSPLDLIIDDASHMLAETRATFETLFPFLRPGGLYMIEDWAWGHATGWNPQDWADRALMSPLISEIMLVCGRNEGAVDRMNIHPNFVTITRGAAALATDGSFALLDHYVTRPGFPYAVDYPLREA
jgi:predicted O-methyltransferase YrrM